MHNDVYCWQTINYSKHSSVNFAYFQHLSTIPCLPSALCLFKNLLFISCGNICLKAIRTRSGDTDAIAFLSSLYYLTTITLNYVEECCKSAAQLLIVYYPIYYPILYNYLLSYYVKHQCTCWVLMSSRSGFLQSIRGTRFLLSCVLR